MLYVFFGTNNTIFRFIFNFYNSFYLYPIWLFISAGRSCSSVMHHFEFLPIFSPKELWFCKLSGSCLIYYRNWATFIKKIVLQAEAAIVTKLIYGKCNPNMLKVWPFSILWPVNGDKISLTPTFFLDQKLALCLSLLPKSKGDEDTWSLMIHKILIAINILLNDSFQGLEEGKSTDTQGYFGNFLITYMV